MSNETKKPLDGVTESKRTLFVHKPGPVYLFNGRKYDLREINDAQAEALADDPACMFIAWKEESKRPQGQKGKFGVQPKEAAPTPGAAPPAQPAKPAATAAGKE